MKHCWNSCYLGCIFTMKMSGVLFIAALNSLSNKKILDRSKKTAFADDKINVTEQLKLVLGRVENIVEKGENAGYQHFLLFLPCFQKALSKWQIRFSSKRLILYHTISTFYNLEREFKVFAFVWKMIFNSSSFSSSKNFIKSLFSLIH